MLFAGYSHASQQQFRLFHLREISHVDEWRGFASLFRFFECFIGALNGIEEAFKGH
jgi:hypothetical protein